MEKNKKMPMDAEQRDQKLKLQSKQRHGQKMKYESLVREQMEDDADYAYLLVKTIKAW